MPDKEICLFIAGHDRGNSPSRNWASLIADSLGQRNLEGRFSAHCSGAGTSKPSPTQQPHGQAHRDLRWWRDRAAAPVRSGASARRVEQVLVLSRLRVILRNTTPTFGKSLRIKCILLGIHPPRQDKQLPPLGVILSRQDRGMATLGEVHMLLRLAQHRVLLGGSSSRMVRVLILSVNTGLSRRCAALTES